MTRPVFPLDAFPGLTFVDEEEGRDVFFEDGPAQERMLRAGGISPRRYSWPVRGYPETAETARLWHLARTLAGEAFYVVDPWDLGLRTGVSVGPAGSGQTVYSLPTSDVVEAYRDHPVEGTVTALVNGTPATVASVDTDGRRVTLAVAPTLGQSVVLSYTYYRLCRFVGGPQWTADAGDWYSGRVEIREVLREPS